MTQAFRIVLLGFSDFERRTLASYFRLATHRVPSYEHVQQLADADFVVADADHGPSVQLVVATERLPQTVFIGWRPPVGCTAWMSRPIDPLHVLRELDAMVSLQQVEADAAPAAEPEPRSGYRTVMQLRRPEATTPVPLDAPGDAGLTLPGVFSMPAGPQPAARGPHSKPATAEDRPWASPTGAPRPVPADAGEAPPGDWLQTSAAELDAGTVPAAARPGGGLAQTALWLPAGPGEGAGLGDPPLHLPEVLPQDGSPPEPSADPPPPPPSQPLVFPRVDPASLEAEPAPTALAGRAQPGSGSGLVEAPVASQEPAAPVVPAAPAAPVVPVVPAAPVASVVPAVPTAPTAPTAPVAPVVAAPLGLAPRPRALLVDDSEIALRFLEARLQPWGLQIDRAGSSPRAIELLSSHSYDLVFLDVELGEDSPMDGLGLCQYIKRGPGLATAPASSVFMVSAHQSQLDRVRGTLAGCDAYLGKPLQDEQLRQVLKRHGLRPVEPGTAVQRPA